MSTVVAKLAIQIVFARIPLIVSLRFLPIRSPLVQLCIRTFELDQLLRDRLRFTGTTIVGTDQTGTILTTCDVGFTVSSIYSYRYLAHTFSILFSSFTHSILNVIVFRFKKKTDKIICRCLKYS